MPEIIKPRYVKTGGGIDDPYFSVQSVKTSNLPYGSSEITREQALDLTQKKLQALQTGKQTTNTQNYISEYQSILTDIQKDQGSMYASAQNPENPAETITNVPIEQYSKMQDTASKIASGEYVEIGKSPTGMPLYGSAVAPTQVNAQQTTPQTAVIGTGIANEDTTQAQRQAQLPPVVPTVQQTQAPVVATGVQGYGPSNYTGVSIVDYLKSLGKSSDYSSRAQLAAQLGIQNYTGTADQNTQMLTALRGGQAGGGNVPVGGQTPATGQPSVPSGVSSGAGTPVVPTTPTTPTITPAPSQGDEVNFRDEIYQKYGIDTRAKDWLNSPTKSFEDVYKDIYTTLDLANVQTKINDVLAKIDKADQDFQTAAGKINENPWLSEAGRVGKIRKLQESYEATRSRLDNQRTLLQNSYDRGREEATNTATRAITTYDKQKQYAKEELEYFINRAESDIAAQETPEEADQYRYLDTQIVEAGGRKLLINSNTGETIKDLGVADTGGTGGGGGLTSAQINSTVNSIAGSFDNEPIVRTYNEVANKYQSIQKIIDSGVGGPGDLALVFEFMKGLDPTSVVRESEYESAARSGNIFRGAMAQFNGYFKAEGGFLPTNVKDSFLSIVKSKFDVATKQYENVYNEYQRQIDDAYQGRPRTITKYQQAFGSDASSDPITDLTDTINKYSSSYDYDWGREDLITKLLPAFPELTQKEIEDYVYKLIPSK